MGKDFGPTTRAAGNYEIHKCGHTKGESKPAAECIMEQIGECGSVGDRRCVSGFVFDCVTSSCTCGSWVGRSGVCELLLLDTHSMHVRPFFARPKPTASLIPACQGHSALSLTSSPNSVAAPQP